MYKNSKDIWVRVFNNLAAAQDWIVLNNQDQGEVNTTTIAVGGVSDTVLSSSKSLTSQYFFLSGLSDGTSADGAWFNVIEDQWKIMYLNVNSLS